MKKAIILCAAVAALLLAACGTGGAPGGGPAAPAPGSSPQVDASGATEVDITLTDNTIQSSLTSFKVGVPYRFVIINNGTHVHNFNINPPVAQAGSEDAALAQALLVVPQDKLPVGGGTTVEYTFPASAAGQTLEMSCLIRRHYEAGMRLAIEVKK